METLEKIHLKYLKNLQPILNKVGKKHGITIQEGEFIISELFISLHKFMNDLRIPTIVLPLIGKLRPSPKRINITIRAYINQYKKGNVTREYVNAAIQYYWPIKQRLIKEKNKQNTWIEWHTMKKLREIKKIK